MFLTLSRFFTYAAVFSVLIVLTGTFFPFIGGKYYFFRLSVEFALICLLLSWAFEPGSTILARVKEVFSRPIVRAVSLFVLAFFLASIFADAPHGAIWSNYERGEGSFHMLHYFAFFLLLGVLFDKESDWRTMFKVSLSAAVLMLLYGVAAAALAPGFVGPYSSGPDQPATALGRIFSQNRFQGSLGNPAYVAPYLLFAFFYALYLWFGRRIGKSNIKRSALYGVLLLFLLTFFILSQTRGAFLGLLAGAFVFFAYVMWTHPVFRKPALITFGVLVVLGTILVMNREKPFIMNLPGSRLLFVSLSENTIQTRLWTWGSAINGWKEHPVFGWGPENFSTVFDKYFDTRHYVPNHSAETWFDRAHSVIFDYLAETGILGLLSFLAIFVVFYYQLLKARVGEENGAAIHGFMVALPIAYLVQGLVLFDVLPIYLNLFLFLAFAGYFLKAHTANE